MRSRYYPLTEAEFIKEIEPHISAHYKRPGRNALISHYEFFCAILYVLRTGVSWRDLPENYGNWHTIYTRFKRWSENGLFWKLVYQLQQMKKVTVDISWIDSTTIPIHRHGSGALKKGLQAVGRGRKGVCSKLHLGLSATKVQGACLSPAQTVDMKAFAQLFKEGNFEGIQLIRAMTTQM